MATGEVVMTGDVGGQLAELNVSGSMSQEGLLLLQMGADEAAWKKYNDQIISPADLMVKAGVHALRVSGYAPLTQGPNDEQYLMTFTQKEVDATAFAPASWAINGRLLEGDIPESAQIQGGPLEKTEVAIVNLDETNGRYWLEAYVKSMHAKNRYTPLVGVKSAHAVFMLDASIVSPFYEDMPEDEQMIGEHVLMDTMFDNDPCQRDAYVNTRLPIPMLDEDGNPELDDFGNPKPTDFNLLLSTEDANAYKKLIEGDPQGNFKGYGSAKRLNKVVDRACAFFYAEYMAKREDPKFDSSRLLSRLDPLTIGFINQYRNNTASAVDWNIPIRGYIRMKKITDFEKLAKKKGWKITDEMEKEHDDIRMQVRLEVIQAVNMAVERVTLEGYTKLFSPQGSNPPSPLRYTISGVDEFDRQYARFLGEDRRTNDPYFNKRAAGARQFEGLPDNTQLVIEPGRGNTVGRKVQGFGEGEPYASNGPGKIAISSGDYMPVHTATGYRTTDIIEPIYNPFLPNKIKGINGLIDTTTQGVQNRVRTMVVDLMEAPGKLLRQIVQAGHYSDTTAGMDSNPRLADMLFDFLDKPYYGVIEMPGGKNHPPRIANFTQDEPDTKEPEPAVFTEGKGVIISNTSEGLIYTPASVRSLALISRLRGMKLKGDDKAAVQDMYGVITKKGKIPADAVSVLGAVVKGRIVHVSAPANNSPSAPTLRVMRNEARLVA